MVIKFKEICDASAAVGLDKNRFLVASDEQSQFALYDLRHRKVLQTISFNEFVELSGKETEVDIEAAAGMGDLIFWISSHGRDSDGNLELNRHQLFATEVKLSKDGVKVKQVGHSYTRLLSDLLKDSTLKKYTREHLDPSQDKHLAPKVKRAVNIEGLSTWKEGLLLGFRNPVPHGRALLVPLLNPKGVVAKRHKPKFGKPLLWKLGQRGIRSIDHWPERDCYIVVAGPYDNDDDFEIYVWSGKRKDQPEPLPKDEIGALNPEATVIFPGRKNKVLIVSDDGSKKIKGSACKDLSRKNRYFRAKWVKL